MSTTGPGMILKICIVEKYGDIIKKTHNNIVVNIVMHVKQQQKPKAIRYNKYIHICAHKSVTGPALNLKICMVQ